MEDVLKFLIIIAAIAIGIAQQYRKGAQKKATAAPTPADNPLPDVEAAPASREAVPRRARRRVEPFIPHSDEPRRDTARPTRPQTPQPTGTTAAAADETGENESEYTIRSADDARRAIVWGEILKRKYD